MSQAEVIEAIKNMTMAERLTVLETTLRPMRAELHGFQKPANQAQQNEQLQAAAQALLADYQNDSELTSFTALDGEDFHVDE